jgi:tetratricopeptide (TPR) repeat protein
MPARPICFMIMPYGTKPTLQKPESPAPAKVNFDRLWEAAIRPTLDALGYDPVRADQDLGALIIQQMIERLAISDLVVADVSIANANVYYEVGIRHAAKPRGCVMVAADWAQPLFDINQMRQVRYPLPAESISDENAASIKSILQTGIPPLASGDSPFYQALPGYPDRLDPQRASSFRDALRELSEFQAEVHATRCAPQSECRDRALKLRQRYFAGGPIQQVVALELLYVLRDCTDFQTTRDFIDSLPKDIRDLPVVQEQRALALSKSGDHITAIGALEELIRLNGETSERRGLLGGRYKRLYASATNPVEKKDFLNRAIRQYELGMKADLNDYYPASNLARLYRARNSKGDDDRARTAAAVTLLGCERARARNVDDPWLKPTLVGAAFDAGDVEKARELADQVSQEGAVAWKLQTTLSDLEFAVGFHEPERAAELSEILDELKGLVPSPVA